MEYVHLGSTGLKISRLALGDTQRQPRHRQAERHECGRAEGRRGGQPDGDDAAPVALAERSVQQPHDDQVQGHRQRDGETDQTVRCGHVVADLLDRHLQTGPERR